MLGGAAVGQVQPSATPNAAPAATPTLAPTPTPVALPTDKEGLKNLNADQIAEVVIFWYGLGRGRIVLDQIRKTALERGKTTVANADGKTEVASYSKFTTRGDSLANERIRLDQEFPSAKYSLIYTPEKTFGIFNDQVFTPRDDAVRTFQNQIFYNLDMLLRYRENGSTLSLVGKDKIGGVDFNVLDVTDKAGRKARFYISVKSWRVMMMEFTDNGISYRRKFYDYNNAQGTLVPFRTVLYANDKIVEETEIGTVTFGQKIDDGTFASN